MTAREDEEPRAEDEPAEPEQDADGKERDDETERDADDRPEADTSAEADAETEEAPGEAPTEPERPLFARDWPASPDLDRLLDAFERGNYAYVRAEAPRVAERASDPAVKAAALDLRKRIDPAPLAGILIFVAIGLLVVLAGHYLGKHNPGAAPAAPPASTNAPLQPPPTSR